MPNQDIQTALLEICKDQDDRRRYSNYYDGKHALMFATEKFRNTFGQIFQTMRDNLCPVVVDSPADRMEIINFSSDNNQADGSTGTDDNAWKLWQHSQMELVSVNTHIEALKTGSAFLIVWPDALGVAKLYLQNSLNCGLVEDEETEEPLFGCKLWRTPDLVYRLNLYYADRIEKYQSPKKTGNIGELKAAQFTPLISETEEAITTNPYQTVPMFKFEAEPVLRDAIPLQDALNKTICDKLVAMEFSAFRQRWATGLEIVTDEVTGQSSAPFKAGTDRLWATDNEKTKFGDFDATDLEQFLKVADSYRLEMARVSGTPLHFFSIDTGNNVSGEALKTLEARFTKKVTRLSLSFGPTWARIMQLALKIENQSAADNLTTQWQSPEQRSENEFLTTLGLKRANLDVPVDTLREEYGYTPEDIAKFNAEAATEIVPPPPEAPPSVSIKAAAG
jgi:hypothetical protein